MTPDQGILILLVVGCMTLAFMVGVLRWMS